MLAEGAEPAVDAFKSRLVSYTHLDVYKRQGNNDAKRYDDGDADQCGRQKPKHPWITMTKKCIGFSPPSTLNPATFDRFNRQA